MSSQPPTPPYGPAPVKRHPSAFGQVAIMFGLLIPGMFVVAVAFFYGDGHSSSPGRRWSAGGS